MKFKDIPLDKGFHFLAGWAIVATIFPFSPFWAAAAVTVIAVSKETWDFNGHGNVELKDFIVTVVGGFFAGMAQILLAIITS